MKMSKSVVLISTIILLAGCVNNGSNSGSIITSITNEDHSNSSSNNSSSNSSTTTGTTSTTTSESTTTNDSTSTSASSTTDETKVESAYTIMIYLCGSDLESGGDDYTLEESSMATSNLEEILSVDLPSNVNVVIETGGAKEWNSKYSIPANKNNRYIVQNNSLKLVQSLSRKNMGASSTLESFVEWGLKNYPAEKTGFIFWDHGGAMQGVCYDENSEDVLLNSEIKSAFTSAFNAVNRSTKLEWVGYDACLMAVQDIADFNSEFFNYMVSSQESEPGEGWDYDSWLVTLAKNPSIETTSLLKNICDTYKVKCAETYNSYGGQYKGYNDATLSVLDLSKMNAYKTAFENIASGLTSLVTSKTKFNSLFSSVLKFGGSEDDNTIVYTYDVFDVNSFISKVSSNSTYSKLSWSTLKTAFNNLVIYNATGEDLSNASGLSMFAAISGYAYKSNYSTSETNFSTWRKLNLSLGSFYK